MCFYGYFIYIYDFIWFEWLKVFVLYVILIVNSKKLKKENLYKNLLLNSWM